MSSIDSIISRLRNSVYGEDMRDAIVDLALNGQVDNMLLCNTIMDTTQVVTFIDNGGVSRIQHKDFSNNVIRTDTFTITENSVTETRTLASGESLQIVTNTQTLATTITHTPPQG